MKKTVISLFIILILASVYFCKDNNQPLSPNGQTPALRYLSFSDLPCQGHPGSLDKALTDDTRLLQHSQNGDTLTLRIHFIANCCPAFVDSAAVSHGNIVISLADTMGFCDCMCEYVNDFKFLYNYPGDLRIVFQWWYLPSQQFTADMDTTIQIN